MLIFSITTATKYLSISIMKDDKYISEINIEANKTHSKYLEEQITSIFKWSNIDLKDIDICIVSIGPGSFTGIRISQSFLKGLFIGSNTKIYIVDEFESFEYENKGKYKPYVLIDAQKEKIYAKIGDKKIVTNLQNIVEFIKEEKEPIYIIGDAYIKHQKYIDKYLSDFNIQNMNKDILTNYVKSTRNIELYLNNKLKQVDIMDLSPDYLEEI